MNSMRERTQAFCNRFGLRLPILLAPMAGVTAPSLSIAVANAGGLGSCGALLMQPNEIASWANEVRANSNGAFQLNLWIPGPPPDFAAQCEALLQVAPPIVSSVMGLYPPDFVTRLKQRVIFWFAAVSTV